jgi:hypothetical protein
MLLPYCLTVAIATQDTSGPDSSDFATLNPNRKDGTGMGAVEATAALGSGSMAGRRSSSATVALLEQRAQAGC